MESMNEQRMSHFKQAVQAFYSGTFNLIYPPECPYCEKPITDIYRNQIKPEFCDSCTDNIQPDISARCLVCDAPTGPHTNTESGCYHCNRERFHFDHVKSLGVYSDEIRNICLRAKAPSGRPLVSASVNLFWKTWGKALSQTKFEMVLPVPFHWLDRFSRTHCSPETIAKELAGHLEIPFSPYVLKKKKRTEKQSSLPVSRRRSNVRNAFQVHNKSTVSGKSILLVDDILTTGSTANEIARCLKKAGALKVSVVVLARALKGARSFVGE